MNSFRQICHEYQGKGSSHTVLGTTQILPDTFPTDHCSTLCSTFCQIIHNCLLSALLIPCIVTYQFVLHWNAVLPPNLRPVLIYLYFPGAQDNAGYTVGGSVALS